MVARTSLWVAGLVGCMAMASYGAELVHEQWLNLWPDKAPFAQGETPADTPAVQVFLPDPARATGAAFVVCPGGGYGGLAPHEGAVVGKWMADNGITAFVLRYRLGPRYHHPVQLGDAQRAIRFVRANAKEWKLDPKRIGIMGFSAGGHLASSAATHYTPGDPASEDPVERVSSRANLQILVYPVITMNPGGHAGSRDNLLGKSPSQELIDYMSSQRQVSKMTPPAFLMHSVTDTVVPVSNSDAYAQSLKDAGIPFEFIRDELGPHGVGLKETWVPQCVEWLRKYKFAAPAAPAATMPSR